MGLRSTTGLALAVLAALPFLAACGSSKEKRADMPMVGPGNFVVTPGGLFLAGFDADGDFRVTAAEVEAGAPKAFAGADTDKSGAVTAGEFQEYSERAIGTDQAVPGRLYFDANVDDKISAGEFKSGLLALLGDYDNNADGVLVRSELLRQIVAPRRGQRGGGPPAGAAPQGR